MEYVADVYVGLGDKEKAIAAVQRAFDDQSASLFIFEFDNPLIKDDPRVRQIAAPVSSDSYAANLPSAETAGSYSPARVAISRISRPYSRRSR